MEHTATSQAGAGTQGVDLGDARSQAILFRITFGGPRVIPGSTPESPDASRIAFGGPLANPGLYIYIYIYVPGLGGSPPGEGSPPSPLWVGWGGP